MARSIRAFRAVGTRGAEMRGSWRVRFAVGLSALLVPLTAAVGGVDPGHPVDQWKGVFLKSGGATISTPSVTTGPANDMLLASYFGGRFAGGGASWTAPLGMTEIADSSSADGLFSGSGDVV